jgi:hypothetical protein
MAAAQVVGGVPAGPEPVIAELPAGRKASAIEVDPVIIESDDAGFDVDEARARALAALEAGDEGGDAPGELPEEEEEKTKPEPKPKPDEPEAEEEEDAHSKRLREELTEKDGKLSQDKLERAFAALTKQEKRLKAKVATLGQERDTFKAERDQVLALRKDVEEARTKDSERRERAKTKPLEALTELGWSYEDLIKYVMQDGKIPPEKLIKDMEAEQSRKFEAVRAELEEAKNDVVKHRTIAAGTDYERRLRASVADALPSFTYLPAYPVKEVQDLVLSIQVGRYEENTKLPEGKQKSLDSIEILKELEQRQAEIVELHSKRLGLKPGQAGAAAANPGTGKSKPLTNDATSERGRRPPPDEDAPFDRDAALEEAIRSLKAS